VAAPVSTRSFELVDGRVVVSRPPPSGGYAAYLEARMAFELDPPDLLRARRAAQRAANLARHDPAPWTLIAAIELARGNARAAQLAVEQALACAPNYAEALVIAAEVDERLAAGDGPARATAAPVDPDPDALAAPSGPSPDRG
jgi:cytochrome c-type biogenesis protein CcmH/NrfG